MVWNGTKENAALVSLVGVVLTLLVTTVLTQREGIRQRELAAATLDQQVQQESLQTYLGDMGELILRDKSPLSEAPPDDAVSRLAQAKTLTVLGGLDPQSKGILLQFLREAQLIKKDDEKAPIISLAGADLSDIEMERADLSDADLSDANLSDANLSDANLSHADLSHADLSHADLSHADPTRITDLFKADLSDADLSDANLSDANLSGANLSGALVYRADLTGTDLTGVDLSFAFLDKAQGVTKDQLKQQAATLEGATMPDGSEHP